MQFWRFSRSLLCHGGFHFIIVFCSDWYKLLLLLFYSWAPARREGKALQRGRISKRNYWNTVVRAPTYLRMYGLLFIYFLTRTKERNARTVSSSRTILTCLHNRWWKIINTKLENRLSSEEIILSIESHRNYTLTAYSIQGFLQVSTTIIRTV